MTTIEADTLPVRRHVEHLMGMPISVALRGRHAATAEGDAAWASVLDCLREVDAVFSTYRADSFVSRLGRGEIDLADCPPEVAQVMALGERARVESGGAFAVVRRDAGGHDVLDPSGVVKGWAVERAARALRALDDTDFCLSAGGDLVAQVADPGRPQWRVGIEDPTDPTRVRAVVPLRHGAVATSGLVHRGGHIVDARTGRVPTTVASVTVVADDLTSADVDATAAFALDADAVRWLAGRGHRAALVVRADGTSEHVGSVTLPD